METKDLTIDDFEQREEISGLIWRKCKLVIVKHSEKNFSIFLVDDVEKPRIPGYPACCLTYYKSKEEALQDIDKTYDRLKYKPQHIETGYYSA